MSRFRSLLGSAFVAAGLLAMSAPAHAGYFIRPYVALGGGGTIDGYVADGPTSGSEQFADVLSSEVNLADGTVRNYLRFDGAQSSGQSAGIFGDSLHFSGPAGSLINLSFAYDGTISSGEATASNLYAYIFASFYVFEAGSGATYRNFDTIGGSVASQSVFQLFNPAVGDSLNEAIANTLVGSFVLDGNGDYDIFASLGLAAATNDNPGPLTMDFLHTAKFGIDTGPDVSFTSDSGVFLTAAVDSAVPEPATWACMILGFGLIGGAMRKSHRHRAPRYSVA